MDEKLQDLLEMTLAERFDRAFVKMLEENPANAAAVSELVRLSGEVEHHPGISEEAQTVLKKFHTADADSNTRFQRYLYIQGAKDCVALLRELGVIK